MKRDSARAMAGWSLIAAPLLLLLWNAIDPAVSDEAAERLTQIADNKARFIVAGYLALLGALAFIPGLVGLWDLFARTGVRLGRIGAGLLLVGMTTTITFFGFGVYEYEAAQPGYDPAQMAKLADRVEAPSELAVPLLVVFLVGVVIGSLLVAWSLWRRRIVRAWSPLAIALGSLLNFVADSVAMSTIASAFTVAGFARVGATLLSRDDRAAHAEPPGPRVREVSGSAPGTA
jgi:hypothetical protein